MILNRWPALSGRNRTGNIKARKVHFRDLTIGPIAAFWFPDFNFASHAARGNQYEVWVSYDDVIEAVSVLSSGGDERAQRLLELSEDVPEDFQTLKLKLGL
jgi:hypothetical protein